MGQTKDGRDLRRRALGILLGAVLLTVGVLPATARADDCDFRAESNCQNCNVSKIRMLGLEGAFEGRFGDMDGEESTSFSGFFDWSGVDREQALSFYAQADRVDPFDVDGDGFSEVSRPELETFLRRREVVWPQVWDGRGFSGKLARRFGVETLPRSFLVDGRGRIVATDLRGEDLLAVLEALLGG